MKLKKVESTETDESGAAAIADRFKLDAVPVQTGPAGVNKTAALIAFLASLAAAAMVGAVAAMMYLNWELIAEA
jgi:hypothetical protein